MSSSSDVSGMFELTLDLGVIHVPDHYNHDTQLGQFNCNYRSDFYYYNDSISDENYGISTVRLEPGRRFKVLVFKQHDPAITTTSEQRLSFLESQGAVHTGAHGLTLVYELKRDELPKGAWYVSFDEQRGLWSDSAGYGVPILDLHSAHAYGLRLGRLHNRWRDVDLTLCFVNA